MSEEGLSVYDPCECLTASEMVARGIKKVVFTIESMTRKEIVGENGRKKDGWRVVFKEKRKSGKPIMVDWACKANMDALATIFGTDNTAKYGGKKVALYTQQTSRGPGIRFAKAE